MWLLITLIILAIASGIGSFIMERKYEYECCGLSVFLVLLFCCTAAGAIIAGLCLADVKSDFKNDLYNYQQTQVLVQSVDPTAGNIQPVIQKVIKVNENIAKHKAYSQSAWIGCFYSKELAKLDYLSYPFVEEKTVEFNDEDASE